MPTAEGEVGESNPCFCGFAGSALQKSIFTFVSLEQFYHS
jgi:hypothetical protein